VSGDEKAPPVSGGAFFASNLVRGRASGYYGSDPAESGIRGNLMTTLSPALREFGEWLAGEFRSDGSFEGVYLCEGDRAHPADLLLRLEVSKKSYYLARVLLEQELLEVGFATEGRVINESIEEMILDNGGDLDDILADELCDLGGEPLPMKHYFERPAFLFVVPFALETPEALSEAALRRQVQNVLKASRILFQGCVDEA
jgi:hypothetical protein